MNLKNLNDETLLTRTSDLALREREITLEILHHIKEIERRRLFSTLGCSSLFTYCTEKLGYSEGSAQRRIQAMRALRDLPEVESKIQSGSLTLSTLAKAQTLFSHQKKSGHAYSPKEKLTFLEKLEDKSAREADRIIVSENPTLGHQEKVRVLADNQNELKTVVDDEFLNLLETLKGRLAHKSPGASTSDLLKYALQAALNQMNRTNPPPTLAVKQEVAGPVAECNQVIVPPTLAVKPKATIQKSVSAPTRREIWRRAENKCENCRSRYALEVDHRTPRALGGGHEQQNLRLLCRKCNQRQAIEKIGLKKMNEYLNAAEQSPADQVCDRYKTT